MRVINMSPYSAISGPVANRAYYVLCRMGMSDDFPDSACIEDPKLINILGDAYRS